MKSSVQVQKVSLVNVQNPLTIPLTSGLSIRVYSDCRPNCLETAALQKGLVLMLHGTEIIEEGVGFGLPVVKYNDKTFFSSTAQVVTQKNGPSLKVSKTFSLDTVSFKTVGNGSYINDTLYSFLRKTFERLYLRNKKVKPVFNKLMELRHAAKIRTIFVKVEPRGTITVNYAFHPDTIRVVVDFSNLNLKNCKEILILNEQGSNFFQKYRDVNGVVLIGNQIGAWEASDAEEACLLNYNDALFFCLKKTDGTKLFRGWENTRNRFSWAGLSYSLQPNRHTFEYSIELGMKPKK